MKAVLVPWFFQRIHLLEEFCLYQYFLTVIKILASFPSFETHKTARIKHPSRIDRANEHSNYGLTANSCILSLTSTMCFSKSRVESSLFRVSVSDAHCCLSTRFTVYDDADYIQ